MKAARSAPTAEWARWRGVRACTRGRLVHAERRARDVEAIHSRLHIVGGLGRPVAASSTGGLGRGTLGHAAAGPGNRGQTTPPFKGKINGSFFLNVSTFG